MQLSKKFLYINSADRLPGGSCHNFQVKLNNRTRQMNLCKQFYIRSVIINSTWYIVNSSNNSFTFINGNTSNNYIIPVGNYSYSQLATTIQNLLNNISSDAWTISYSSISSLFKFSTNNSSSFGLDATSNTSILWQLMGFKQQVYTSSTNTINSAYVADLSGIKYLYIKSSALGFQGGQHEHNSTNLNDTNIICTVPVNVNSFETINYDNYNSNNLIIFNQQLPDIIDIQSTSYNNQTVDLNGNDWQFIIEAEFEPLESYKLR